jgi:uncharacterized protein YifN (PemK superfamily)
VKETKRIATIEELVANLQDTLDRMANQKQRAELINSLNDYFRYVNQEKKFLSQDTRVYRVGDIIDVDFGRNVGAEFRGRHFALVIVKSNHKSKKVNVVPLSSYTSKKDIRSDNVDLGVIPELNAHRNNKIVKRTRAIVDQMGAVSKIKIYPQKICGLDKGKLKMVQRKIMILFTGNVYNDMISEILHGITRDSNPS